MTAPANKPYMAVVGVRLLAQCLAMLYAVGAGGVLYLFGLNREALRAFVVGAIIAWAVAPDKESRAAYLAFQRRRQGLPDE
jgi:hypothetical protein